MTEIWWREAFLQHATFNVIRFDVRQHMYRLSTRHIECHLRGGKFQHFLQPPTCYTGKHPTCLSWLHFVVHRRGYNAPPPSCTKDRLCATCELGYYPKVFRVLYIMSKTRDEEAAHVATVWCFPTATLLAPVSQAKIFSRVRRGTSVLCPLAWRTLAPPHPRPS